MKRTRKQKIEENLDGYVKLVETMLTNVFERLKIKESWYYRKISKRMLEKKRKDLDELGEWLRTPDSHAWFDIFGTCTTRSSRKMHEIFTNRHSESVKFINNHSKKKKNGKPKRKLL